MSVTVNDAPSVKYKELYVFTSGQKQNIHWGGALISSGFHHTGLRNIQRDDCCQRNRTATVKKDVGPSGTMFSDIRKEPFSFTHTLANRKGKVLLF